MRGFLALVTKDLRLAWRSHLLYLALATALAGVAVGHLVRGGDITFAEGVYLVDHTGAAGLQRALAEDMQARGFAPLVRGSAAGDLPSRADGELTRGAGEQHPRENRGQRAADRDSLQPGGDRGHRAPDRDSLQPGGDRGQPDGGEAGGQDPDAVSERLAKPAGKHQAWLADEAALRSALRDAEVGFGAVLTGGDDGFDARYLMPDLLPEKTARLMARIWDDGLHAAAQGRAHGFESVPVMTEGAATEAPPLGHAFVPLFVFTEAFVVALWLGAVLLFMERSGRTAQALLVSPAGVRGMLAAKTTALALVVVLEVVVTVVGVWGWHPGLWGALAASMVLFLQAMGVTLLLAGWFQSLTGFTLVGAGLTFLATLPTISFFSSSFPDLWWHPTYAPFRALRESFFPSGRTDLLLVNLAIGAAVAAVLMTAGAVAYRRRLVRA